MPTKKVDIDIVKKALLNEVKESTEKVMRAIEKMIRQMEEEADEKSPAPKKQFVIVVSDPNGVLKETELVGWVLQIPEDASPSTTLDAAHQAAYAFNQTPKGRRLGVEKFGEAMEIVPQKIFKEHNVFVKTKEPVQVVVTDNKIPKG